jgi:hypothetical protein
MTTFKLISLATILGLFFVVTPLAQAQDESLVSQELAIDEITAAKLSVEEPASTEGDGGYWWQNLKRNVDLFFTFDEVKKAVKEEKYSGQLLLEAKQIINKNPNDVENINKTLERYRQMKKKLSNRVQSSTEVRERIMEKVDQAEFDHQQLLREISDGVPSDVAKKLETLREENALRWYNSNKEQVADRLQKVIDSKNVGSKLQQFKHLATVAELEDVVPENVKADLETVKDAAQARLTETLKNATTADAAKVEKYIEKINLSSVIKQKFVNTLQENDKLPSSVQNTLSNVAQSYSERLRQKFENLNDDGKRKFLDEFDTRTHPEYMKFLQEIDVPDNLRDKVDTLLEKQSQGVRAKIRATDDVQKLRSLENSFRANPVMLKEIRERRTNVTPLAPSPSIRPQQPSILDQQ